MSRLLLTFAAFLAAVSIFGLNPPAAAQDDTSRGRAEGEAVLTRLAPPGYPQIDRTAHITGDVIIEVAVMQDGTVQSTTIISGPPLLTNSSLESAKQSQFKCQNCGAEPTKLWLRYTYQLLPGTCNGQPDASDITKPDGGVPGVTQDSNDIIIVDYGFIICDPSATITRVRSWKCLYLWHCAAR
jgi:hypothetical protein